MWSQDSVAEGLWQQALNSINGCTIGFARGRSPH